MINIKILLDTIDSFNKKHEELKKYLEPLGLEQKHLNKGSIEQKYWHYGYCIALRDVLIAIDNSILSGDKTPH